jgi:hypothetical protein
MHNNSTFRCIYALVTSMPVDPSLTLLRGGLVLLGGVLSWLLAMLGWVVHPHKPETHAVKKVYKR